MYDAINRLATANYGDGQTQWAVDRGVHFNVQQRTLTWNISPAVAGGPVGDYQVLIGTSDSTLLMHFLFGSQQRKSAYWLVDNWDDTFLSTTYDTDNNALTQESDYNPHLGDDGFIVREDVSTYGQHANVLTQGVANGYSGSNWTLYPGQTSTTYYNASQYFQKSGSTDMDGHTTTMTVGTNTAGNTGDPDPNIGDRGQVLTVQDAGYNDSSSPSYHKQYTYTYNQYGQKISETNLNGTVTQYTYGTANNTAQGWYDLGNLTQVVQDPGTGHLNRTTSMHYDAMGRVIQSTDPAGLTSTFTYNTLGQPMSVATPARGSIPGETISYAYDANGRTHSVQDSRGVTVMAYEPGSDRVASVTDPVTGTTSYTYQLTGERNTMTLAGGGTWTYTYQTMSGGNGLPGYINWCNLPKDDPNSLCRTLANIQDDQGRQVDFTIDLTGKVISSKTDEVYTTGGSLVAYMETDPTFDVNASIYTHFWLSQTKTTWHWSPTGSVWYSRLVSQNAYTYDNAGQRLTNLVTQMTPGTGGAPQYTGGTPTYDGNGNATNEITSSRTEKYEKSDGSSGYDDLNRLTNVDYGDGQTQVYTFDAMGNRTQRVDSASGTTTYGYDAANRLTGTTGTGASTYTNDLDGNTLTGGGRTSTWDSQNRMVSCIISGSSNTFKYGADGLRRQKTTNSVTTDYAYDGTMMVREGHATGGSLTASTVTATYFQGASGPCYRRDDTQTETDGQGHTFGKTRWYVNDGLGSVVGELDPLGDLTSSPKYDVYGAVRSNGGTASSKHGFVGSLGHLSEAETGLIYMRARYMDPQLGRFVSQDPAKNGNNWLIYCENNPINKVDTTGRFPLPPPEVLEFIIHTALDNATELYSSLSELREYAGWLLDAAKGGATKAGVEDAGGLEQKLIGDDPGGDALQLQAGKDAITAATEVAEAEELQSVIDWISEGNPNFGE